LSRVNKIPENAAIHEQPIILVGGFLSSEHTYRKMQGFLQKISGQTVWVVPIDAHIWFGSIALSGWVLLLNKIEDTVRQAVQESKTGRATLIGHSSGGILGRLFLSPDPLRGHVYNGLSYIDTLITLGSPHYNHKGASLRKWVEEKYPGAYYDPRVRYISVVGKAIQGIKRGSPRERLTYWFYKTLCGRGDVWGDGFVPIPSALLKGSQEIIVDGIRHYSRSKHLWYGSETAVHSWWKRVDTERHSQMG
jgi:pimeloyl-ACP methyl ester carboxylesterase